MNKIRRERGKRAVSYGVSERVLWRGWKRCSRTYLSVCSYIYLISQVLVTLINLIPYTNFIQFSIFLSAILYFILLTLYQFNRYNKLLVSTFSHTQKRSSSMCFVWECKTGLRQRHCAEIITKNNGYSTLNT